MNTFFKVAAMGLAVSLSMAVSAQDFAAVDSSNQSPTGTPPGPGDILWDNTDIANTTAGIVSTTLGGVPATAETADDIVVPSDEIWTIEFVYTEGFTNGSANADSFDVIIYDDAGGIPGSVVSAQNIPFGGVVNMTTQELTLPTPVELGGGTYWVSVVGVFDTGTDLAVSRWNWNTGPTPVAGEWHLQDSGLFGGLPWTSATGLGITDVSAFFLVRGSRAPAFQIQQVPTLDTWAMILMMLAFLGAATIAVRRFS